MSLAKADAALQPSRAREYGFVQFARVEYRAGSGRMTLVGNENVGIASNIAS